MGSRGYRRGICVAIALALVVAAPASAAPQTANIGQAGPFVPPANFGSFSQISVPNPVVQARTSPGDPSFEVPFDGVITEFRYRSYSNQSPTVQLAVVELRDTFPTFHVRAYSSVGVAGPYGSVQAYPTRLPARAGDRIGIHSSDVDAWFHATGDDQARQLDTLASPGQSTMASGFYNQSRANVAATVESDEDGDGHGDVTGDNCVGTFNDPQTNTDGDGQGDACDGDDDNDGTGDGSDAFPLNAAETRDTDADGTGDNADGDDDNDGAADGADAFPRDASETTDSDGDGRGDNVDEDDDNDGAADRSDAFPRDASETRDSDGDGIGDNADPDDDNDGRPDGFVAEAPEEADADADGRPDRVDEDDDNDRLSDALEGPRGTSPVDVDSDDDGLSDPDERRTDPAAADSDRDGLPDGRELGVTQPVPDPLGAALGTAAELFAPDAHPRSKTNPLKRDTDRDGLADGREDRNRNGKRERRETDPRKRDTDRDGIVDGRDRKPLTRGGSRR